MAIISSPASIEEIAEIVALDYECLSGEAWPAELWLNFLQKRQCLLIRETMAFALFSIAADEAEMIKVAVAPSHQRQGAGARLIEKALGILADQGINKVALEVRASNRGARALYQKLGFAQVGLRIKYYQHPVEDVQTWVKDLD